MKASRSLASRFTVREFYYDETEIKREREEMTRLLSDKKQQYVSTRYGLAEFQARCSAVPSHSLQRPRLSPVPWEPAAEEHVPSRGCQSRVRGQATGTSHCGGSM